MSLFNSPIVLGWSGGNDRGLTSKADAARVCVARKGMTEPPVNLRNRHVAEGWILAVDAAIARLAA